MIATSILRRFRWVLGLFMFALVMSGITAFPLQRELDEIVALRGLEQVAPADGGNTFDRWILTVRDGLRASYARHPWLAYGTDWLAFAHIVIALFFIGPFIDAVRNVLEGLIRAIFLLGPVAGRCGGRNRDAAFAFLVHPVRNGVAVIDIAHFVNETRVEQDAFGRSGFAGVNVRGNADVARALHWVLPVGRIRPTRLGSRCRHRFRFFCYCFHFLTSYLIMKTPRE